jgi:polar amino acid transport system ATP-binding protein
MTSAMPPVAGKTDAHQALSVEDVYQSFGPKRVLRGVDLSISKGESVAIIGPSGGGKSTLLRTMNLLEPIDSGKLWREGFLVVDGAIVNVSPDLYRREVGMVFQDFLLWPNRTVLGNVSDALLHVLKLTNHQAIDRARCWLDKCGVLDEQSSYPHTLSGGQKQRVALARALAMEPTVLLLDEITSHLDVVTAGQILALLRSLRDGERTWIFVTHHLEFAKQNTDRVAVLIDGKVNETGPSRRVLEEPASQQTREFLSQLQAVW